MPTPRCAWVLTMVAAVLPSGSLGAEQPAPPGSSPSGQPRVTRVFYLERIEVPEALTLLRSEVAIRSAATIESRSAIVVSDALERAELAESLLRQRDAGLRATDPHPPLDLEGLAASPKATREFRAIDQTAGKTMLTALRALYGIRELASLAAGEGVSVRAAEPILDASEALLRELGLLADPAADKAP